MQLADCMIGFDSTPLRVTNKGAPEEIVYFRIEDAERKLWGWSWVYINC